MPVKIKNAKGDEILEVYSLTGDLLSRRYVGNEEPVSLEDLQTGVYFYKVWGKGKMIKSEKLLAQ